MGFAIGAGAAIWACPAVTANPRQASSGVVRCGVSSNRKGESKTMMQAEMMPRREALAAIVLGGGALSWLPASLANANAAGLPPGPPPPTLCDENCVKDLENVCLPSTLFGFMSIKGIENLISSD